MKTIKNVLILCDAHDCIKYNANNTSILKQLHVIVFLLRKYFLADNHILHINNRAIFDFDVFWKPKSRISNFLANSISKKSWEDISMLDYDIIITHPEYQDELKWYFSAKYGIERDSRIYSILELDYDREIIFPSAGMLFTKGGLLELNDIQKKDISLSSFKQELDQSTNDFSRDKQEAIFPNIECLVKDFAALLNIDNLKNVLILDLHNKNSYIGDSVIWFSKIKKLFDFFPEHCNIRLNISNKTARSTISNIFQKSLPSSITITNTNWNEISMNEFDLILCSSDILFKLHSHMHLYSSEILNQLLIYTFTIDSNSPFSEKPTFDFLTNIYYSKFAHRLNQANKREKENAFNEISLLEEEHNWAKKWLANNRVHKKDKLIVILHGASGFSKVICELEQLKLIKHLCRLNNDIKVLLVSDKSDETTWIKGALTIDERKSFILAEALELREVMSLLANQQIVITIGPCTGLMHVSNNLYTYLFNHKILSKEELPLLLTYTGKQPLVGCYDPNFWWKNSKLVDCCVFLTETDNTKEGRLVPLEDCPTDTESFYNQSICAYDIRHETLLNYIAHKSPNAIKRLGITDFNSILSDLGNRGTRNTRIPTFVINLKERVDRREHMAKQFLGRTEFDCTIVDAIKSKSGSMGLWYTIKKILIDTAALDYEYILICEDDHEFTEHYTDQLLLSYIDKALMLKAEILLGGIGGFDGDIKLIHTNLISLEGFACTQFTIIFKPFFKKILEVEFTENDCVDFKLAEISNRKLVTYPFISTQKDFGYSDVSDGYFENKMTKYFNTASELIQEMLFI